MAIDTEERTPTKNKSTTGASQPGASKSNKKLIIIILSVVGGLIVLSIIGTIVSGMLAKKAFESGISAVTGGRVQVDTNKDGADMTIKGDDGSTMDYKSGKELPKDFPSEVLIYSGAELQGSSVTTLGEGGSSYVLSFHSSASRDEVFEFYQSEFAKNGWKTNSTQQTDAFEQIHASNESADMSASYSSVLDEPGSGTDFRLVVNTDQSKH